MVLLVTFCLRMTKNSTGTITAATMMSVRTIMSVMKPHSGSPQQRRPFFSFSEFKSDIDSSPGRPRGVKLLLLRAKGGRGQERTESRKL